MGYWPFGFVAASGDVARTVLAAGPFVHGFTYSHSPVGAAVARTVLRIIEEESLVEASATMGDRLRALLTDRLGDHPNVGDIRGRGLMVGLELVADRPSRRPYPRAVRLTEVDRAQVPCQRPARLLGHGQRGWRWTGTASCSAPRSS